MIRSRGRGAPVRGGTGGRGRGRGQSAAQLLLQKASTQLRGERVPIKPREEDELASYLNSLTQKTSQQTKSVNYEEYGDISISSGAEPVTPRIRRTPSPVAGAGSKFLKKKPAPSSDNVAPVLTAAPAAASSRKPGSTGGGGAFANKTPSARSSYLDDDDDDDDIADVRGAAASKPVNVTGVGTAGRGGAMLRGAGAGMRGGAQVSTALNKATALTNKITQRSSDMGSRRRTRGSLLDSDTDESIGPVLHGKKRGGRGSRPGSASDNSIGHDGNKFMKKREEAKADRSDKERKPESPVRATSKRSKSKDAADQRMRSSNAGSLFRKSSNVYLTSEEESLAEFMQALSGSEESRSGQGRTKQADTKAKRQASRSPFSDSPSPNRPNRRQTPSPTPSAGKGNVFRRSSRPVFHRRSSQDSDSVPSDLADVHHEKIMIADSISFDEPLELNLMDANTLGPIVLTTPEPASYSETNRKSSKTRHSPFRRSQSPSPSQKKKPQTKKANMKKKKSKSSIFESFGVQSVEDLLKTASDKENTDESEIITEPLEFKKRHKDQSTSQIVTEIGSRGTMRRQVSYSEDFEEKSISERIGTVADKKKDRWARRVSVSSMATQYSDEETGVDYSEDFASETLSLAKDSDSDRSSHYRYSDDETEESRAVSATRANPAGKRGEKKVIVESRSVEIQTAAPAGLNYQWYSQTGVSVLGPSLGLGNVDPTPIAATVISSDALETMTAYSPATLAIHDMLKQQIELIKQFASAHDRLYHSLTDTNVPDYKYTTVEGTKAYIKKHRRPRLTMKQALKMVSEEMGQ